ncbi:UNVERIFIED_CONTAM: hypothetical protein OHV15_05820 [Microbacterium sp. SLM126]
MTFFEPGPTDSQRRHSDDPLSTPREERRRRATVRWSSAVAALCAVLFVAVVVIGPSTVLGAVRSVFDPGYADLSDEVMALAEKAHLTEEGMQLLIETRPQLVDRDAVAEACQRPADDPPLGCYVAVGNFDRIFVAQPADPRAADLAVTTLAHELLHAAYANLSSAERARLGPLLTAELERVAIDDPIRRSIEWSVGGHEASLETEIFAYLGSEVVRVDGFAPDLEAVYARFFTDRVALASISGRLTHD